MEEKSSNHARKQALRKTDVMRWLDYPEYQPNVGDEVVICYTSNKELGLQKRELVEWTFKTMNNSANNPNLKFKWLRLPSIAKQLNKRNSKVDVKTLTKL